MTRPERMEIPIVDGVPQVDHFTGTEAKALLRGTIVEHMQSQQMAARLLVLAS